MIFNNCELGPTDCPNQSLVIPCYDSYRSYRGLLVPPRSFTSLGNLFWCDTLGAPAAAVLV